MSSGRSASLCWTLLSVCLLASSSAGQINITTGPGQTVSLPCKALNNDTVIVVDWRRIDPKPEEDLLLYRDERFDTANQNPSYKNRVDLQDRQMKDGDVSLILKNVTKEDSGTYECYVVQRRTNRRKRAVPVESISIIRLEVVPPDGHKEDGGDKQGGDKEGSVGLIVGLIAGVVVVAVVVSLITVRHMKKKSSPPSSSSSSPTLQSADQSLV